MRKVGTRHNGSGGCGANYFFWLHLFKMPFRKILLLKTLYPVAFTTVLLVSRRPTGLLPSHLFGNFENTFHLDHIQWPLGRLELIGCALSIFDRACHELDKGIKSIEGTTEVFGDELLALSS